MKHRIVILGAFVPLTALPIVSLASTHDTLDHEIGDESSSVESPAAPEAPTAVNCGLYAADTTTTFPERTRRQVLTTGYEYVRFTHQLKPGNVAASPGRIVPICNNLQLPTSDRFHATEWHGFPYKQGGLDSIHVYEQCIDQSASGGAGHLHGTSKASTGGTGYARACGVLGVDCTGFIAKSFEVGEGRHDRLHAEAPRHPQRDGPRRHRVVAFPLTGDTTAWPSRRGSITPSRDTDGASKVAFDKFHVAGHLGDAVNKVRREEHEMLQAAGDHRLKGTRFWWLYNPERSMSEKQWLSFESLRCSSLKTARAWSIKEAAMEVWEHAPRDDLRSQWTKWYGWAIRSQLEPIKAVARTVKRHLGGIILAAKESITTASAEGLNSVVQMLKHVAHGYRNRDRFRNAIYFHLGGLDLHPHTIAGANC